MKHYEKELKPSKRELQSWNYWSIPSVNPKPKTHEQQLEETKRIIEVICHYYELPYKIVIGKSRIPRFVIIRHITIYFIKKRTDLSLVDIGKLFDRDHTTIIHALKNVEAKRTHPYDQSVKTDLFNINLLL